MAKPSKRQMYTTLLIVAEGDTEVAFLKHLKNLLVARQSGLKIKVLNAHGKGAKGVIDTAIKQPKGYDTVAVFFDTDKDWNTNIEKRAKEKKILLLPSEPQFEAMLLRALKKSDTGDSDALKQRFAKILGGDPLDTKSYEKIFTKEQLQESRKIEKTLEDLLVLLRA
ncbi:MAG: RloB domain-containing protein [Betaproteobacteria bacterium]|nr:RloB domain-containing protein [Betaproteobacteria bacterium]